MKKDHNDFRILKSIETGTSVSQRKLASQMELNVASVSFILKDLINKGFVTKVGEFPMSAKYGITHDGLREKKRLAYNFYRENIAYYKEVRDDIEARIEEATNSIETDIAIYGISERADIAYMVVSKKKLSFLGFFVEDSKFTNKKILGNNVQNFNLLKRNRNCLLLLTEKFPVDELNELDTKNVDTLDLVDDNPVRLN